MGGGGASVSAIEPIAEVVVGAGGAASIDFSSIPATYRHLRLVFSGRLESGASLVQGVLIRLNNDSAANYWFGYLRGVSSVASAGFVADTGVQFLASDAAAIADAPTAVDVLFIDYLSTVFHKKLLLRSSSHYNASANSYNEALDGLWRSTAAVNQITLVPPVDFLEGTVATLYGIKGT